MGFVDCNGNVPHEDDNIGNHLFVLNIVTNTTDCSIRVFCIICPFRIFLVSVLASVMDTPMKSM